MSALVVSDEEGDETGKSEQLVAASEGSFSVSTALVPSEGSSERLPLPSTAKSSASSGKAHALFLFSVLSDSASAALQVVF